MNISLSGILFLVSCILIATTIIGIILLRLSSGGNKPTKNVDHEDVLRHQKRKRIVAQKAEEAFQLLQRDDVDFRITYRHDSPKRFYKKEELPDKRRGYTGSGKQKVVA